MTDPHNPAFPQSQEIYGGLSVREYASIEALKGILAGGFGDTIPHDDVNGGEVAASFAVMYADALIRELNK